MASEGIRDITGPDGHTYLNAVMNKKNVWGTILTLLGASGLIYAAVWFVNTSAETNNTKALVVLAHLV